jgi:metallo-beta-lactamase family protein
MALMREEKPHIVISAAGMCEAGRILHHLRYKIHNPKTRFLSSATWRSTPWAAAFLKKAVNTGIPDAREIRRSSVSWEKIPLAARVENMDGFSAHADKDEMLRFLKESNLKIKKIALVHGEEDQLSAFADTLQGEGYKVFIPRFGESLRVG